MSRRAVIRLSIWCLLFLTVFGVCLRVLPTRPVMTITLPEQWSGVSFSPDGALLMTKPGVKPTGQPGPLRFWRVPSGHQQILPLKEPASDFFASFVPGGRLLFLRWLIEERKLWSLYFVELASGNEWLHVESAVPCGGCISGDGQKLACLSIAPEEGHAEIWDVPRRRREATLELGRPLALSQNGRLLLCYSHGAKAERELVIWDVTAKHELGRISIPAQASPIAQFSPDGKVLALNSYPKFVDPRLPEPDQPVGFLKLIDVHTQRMIATSIPAGFFSFTPTGEVLLATPFGEGNRVRSWNTETGQLDELVLAGERSIGGIAVSPDGCSVAVTTLDLKPPALPMLSLWLSKLGFVQRRGIPLRTTLFNLSTKEAYGTMEGEVQAGTQSFSPDGSLLAVAGTSGTVEVWDVQPRKPFWLAVSLALLAVVTVWLVGFAHRRLRRSVSGREKTPRSRRPTDIVYIDSPSVGRYVSPRLQASRTYHGHAKIAVIGCRNRSGFGGKHRSGAGGDRAT